MPEVSHQALAEAIENLHGCKATWRESVPVTEMFNGETVWTGEVHVFDVDHPDSDTCYAWSHSVDVSENRQFYAVLGKPPVDTPRDAVRAAIAGTNRT